MANNIAETEAKWLSDIRGFVDRARNLPKKPGHVVRMRGLPFECTAAEVVEFFRRNEPAEVVDGEDGVHFLKKVDGKPTGEAFVIFKNEKNFTAAMCKNKYLIRSRYIELFGIPLNDVEHVARRIRTAKPKAPSLQSTSAVAATVAAVAAAATVQNQANGLLPPNMAHGRPPPHSQYFAALPPMMMHGNAAPASAPPRDCLRVRGLPSEAQVQHILEFLGPNAKHIAEHGVHMIINAMGQPTGDAFVRMDSETNAQNAANSCNRKCMIFGKKKRYIDIVQCSMDDITPYLLNNNYISPMADMNAYWLNGINQQQYSSPYQQEFVYYQMMMPPNCVPCCKQCLAMNGAHSYFNSPMDLVGQHGISNISM